MNEMPSAEFRKQYPKLTKLTVVTVNGHPIGTWVPSTTHFAPPEEIIRDDVVKLPGGGIQARQSQRDELLRKINRGK